MGSLNRHDEANTFTLILSRNPPREDLAVTQGDVFSDVMMRHRASFKTRPVIYLVFIEPV